MLVRQSVIVTVAIVLCGRTAAVQVCPLRQKLFDDTEELISLCPSVGSTESVYDTESCMQAAIAAGGNAMNLDRGVANCYIKTCDLSALDVTSHSDREVYVKSESGAYKKLWDATSTNALGCSNIGTDSTAKTAEECALACDNQGGNAFNFKPPNYCNFKQCSDGDQQVEYFAEPVHAGFMLTCMEMSELVTTRGTGRFSTGTVLDGDSNTCLDPTTTTANHFLAFNLPIVVEALTVLVVGNNLKCSTDDYHVYIPVTPEPAQQFCQPKATNLKWETGNPVRCHFSCECAAHGGCGEVRFRMMTPLELCEIVIYMNEDRIVVSPDVTP